MVALVFGWGKWVVVLWIQEIKMTVHKVSEIDQSLSINFFSNQTSVHYKVSIIKKKRVINLCPNSEKIANTDPIWGHEVDCIKN